MSESEKAIEKAIEELTYADRIFPRKALEVITANKEEAIPFLRAAIEKAMRKNYDLEEGYQLHFYALFLLGEFQDREFFLEIMRFAALPDNQLDFLIGDTITSGLKDIIYNTYNGDIELLKKTATDENVDEFVRSGLLEVMGQLYLDGELEKGEWKAFLRKNVYDGKEYSYFYSGLAAVICDCHFVDMLPEIRYMLDHDLMDEMALGKYDSCVDEMFSYQGDEDGFCKSPLNTIKNLQSWAMFEKTSNTSKDGQDSEWDEKAFEKLMRQEMNGSRAQNSSRKIGRNDPCPCGSGKKYKFCCMNKPASPLDAIESAQERSKALERYPYTGKEKLENREYLENYFDSESIEIDKLLYLGLMHRPGWIWLRDEKKEEKRRREYLSLAFEKFQDKIKKENVQSLKEYNAKFSIHYECEEWIDELLRLLKEAGDREKYREIQSLYKSLSD